MRRRRRRRSRREATNKAHNTHAIFRACFFFFFNLNTVLCNVITPLDVLRSSDRGPPVDYLSCNGSTPEEAFQLNWICIISWSVKLLLIYLTSYYIFFFDTCTRTTRFQAPKASWKLLFFHQPETQGERRILPVLTVFRYDVFQINILRFFFVLDFYV